MHTFSTRDFRNAMGRFATGVTVVTMRGPAAEHARHELQGSRSHALENGTRNGASVSYGLTVNAFMSVSLEPMLIGIAIDKSAQAHLTLTSSDRFGVSVLNDAQQQLSDRFAGRLVPSMPDPFTELAGFPVIAGAITQIVARKQGAVDAGDHTIFLGAVEQLRCHEGKPLLFFKGDYESLREPGQVEADLLEAELAESGSSPVW